MTTPTHHRLLYHYHHVELLHQDRRYVSVDEENGVQLFYYFIQSEGDPRSDPILLWLTGGDRCSVLSSLAFEVGPVKFVIEPYNGSLPRLQYNVYSWTKAASIIFVDSPVGAGFSFSRKVKGYDVGDISASLQLKEFLAKTICEHCNGEDYSKPKNVICAQALNRFTKTYKNYVSYFWANNNIIRDALGIKKGRMDEWLRCHDWDLPYSQDIKSNIKYHRNVTLKGYRALVYRY
ncbi:hypothetical protein C2845_PM18G05790 [Panicum miliaceum]|uniref:Uncharacterized protein n=1 Tax=Panicum miliaceum TaxID=4540 RepID=A0A3L6PHY7_PANMI|nr:hypothetical protein C2845_PM18G05790 [Panicum miliaceum]